MDKLLIFWAGLFVFAALLVFIYMCWVKHQARAEARASVLMAHAVQEKKRLAMNVAIREQRKLGARAKKELKEAASKNRSTKIEVGGVNMGDMGYRLMVRCVELQKAYAIMQLDFKSLRGRLTISLLEHGPGEFVVRGVTPEEFESQLAQIKEKIELYDYSEVIR